jgi:hypothetical protein
VESLWNFKEQGVLIKINEDEGTKLQRNHRIKNIGIKCVTDNITVDERQTVKIWKNYNTDSRNQSWNMNMKYRRGVPLYCKANQR